MRKSINHIIILISILAIFGCGTTMDNCYSTRGRTFGNDTVAVLKKSEKIRTLNIENYTYSEFPNIVINRLSQIEEISIRSRKWPDILYEQDTKIDILKINDSILDSLTYLNTVNFSGFTFHSFPYELSSLENLKTLKIWLGRIEIFPDNLASFRSLRKLDLADNEISKISNSVLLPVTLEELIISGNNLKDFPIEIIPINLKNIDLSRNNFSFSKKIELIQRLESIEHLEQIIIDVQSHEEKKTIKHLLDDNKLKKRIKIIKTPANISYSI